MACLLFFQKHFFFFLINVKSCLHVFKERQLIIGSSEVNTLHLHGGVVFFFLFVCVGGFFEHYMQLHDKELCKRILSLNL